MSNSCQSLSFYDVVVMRVCDMYLGLISPAPLPLNHPSAAVYPRSPRLCILDPGFSTAVMKVEEPAGRNSWWWCKQKKNKKNKQIGAKEE